MREFIGWQQLSPAERERAYSPSSCIGGNYQPFIKAYVDRSAAAYAAHPPQVLAYGPGVKHTIDLFLPKKTKTKPPLLLFIHGGYWQELSKRESTFAAPDCLRLGIAFGALDYTLAPEASLDDIVAECRMALGWLGENGEAAGIDPERIIIAGSSAGAHLAAMTALRGEGPDGPLPGALAKGAILVSGVYDLEPLIGTSINTALGLDPESAGRNSPLLQPLAGFPPSIIAWGDNETDQFKRQSRAFARALRGVRADFKEFEVNGRNHFDVILDLADPSAVLGEHVMQLIAVSGA